MNVRVLPLIALLVLAGCADIPGRKPEGPSAGPAPSGQTSAGAPAVPRSGTLAAYTTAIVRDLVIEERGLVNIAGANLDAFNNGEAEIIRVYGDTLRDALQKKRYFAAVVSDGPTANAVVIEPRAMIVDPGMRTSMFTGKPTRIELTVSMTDAATGKPLGSYPVSFTTLFDDRLDVVGKMKRYFGIVATRTADGVAAFR